MTASLQQLESTEAIVLMYLSGELSARDRAAVEQRIATDGSFAGTRASVLPPDKWQRRSTVRPG